MRTHMLRAGLTGMAALAIGGCMVAVPANEPLYGRPAVVVEPPSYRWRWWAVPHYEVEHHYIVDNERVNIRDRHYQPFARQTRRYLKNDQGEHKGWFKHDDD